MSNDKKTIEKLTSRVKIYLVIIALLFILICIYDQRIINGTLQHKERNYTLEKARK